MSAATESADWCVQNESFAMCGTRMKEDSRESMGIRWCFHCRTRHEFFDVLMVPDGFSWSDPHREVVGPKDDCTDLFPGWSREWVED
jgi:hypothetical protein